MNKIMKYKIIKPINDTWKEFGDTLYKIQNETREILNKSTQLCWEYQGFSSEYKEENGEYPKTKDILGYSSNHGYCYNKLKENYSLNSANFTTTVKSATDKWKADLKDVIRGDKSIASYKKDSPIDLHNGSINKLYCDDKNYYVNISLINNTYADLLNRKGCKKCQYTVVIEAKDGTQTSILNKCINGEYKISASMIQKKDKHWYLLLCYKFEPVKKELDKHKIMGIDMGIKYPIYYSINESKKEGEYKGWCKGFIEGGEIESFRLHTERRRNELKRQGKYCGEGRIGHGIRTRIKPTEKISDKIARFRDTTNHKYSKYIIDEAIKNDCGIIQMEDLSGISTRSAFLKKWSYFDLQQKITYKALEVGIEVIKIAPKYTSQRCSECGHIDAENRLTQSEFECRKCGNKLNADQNASRNISIRDIDRIIEETLAIQDTKIETF